MPDTKITNLTLKTPAAATDELVINDVAGGNADKKITVADLRLTESQITNLVSDLAAKEATANKGAASGYASLTASTKHLATEIPFGSAVNTVCQGNDARLSDALTPLAHKSTHVSGGSDTFVKGDILVASAQYLQAVADPASDSRRMWIDTANNITAKYWDNQATPVKQTLEILSNKNVASGYAGLDGSTKLTGSQQTYGTIVNTACEGNDARLSDARTPTTHKTTHVVGGTDAFISTDLLDATIRYLEGITDPASARRRTWMNVKDLKFWSDEVTPVLQTVERQANKAAASGYPSLDGSTLVPTAQEGTGTADATTFLRGDRTWAVPTATATSSWKNSVRAATTANITLSGTQTVDGVALVAGDICLVKNQTTGSENGKYTVAAGAWTRTSDFDAGADLISSALAAIQEGTTNLDKVFQCTTNEPITVGTTALVFAEFGAGTGATDIKQIEVDFGTTPIPNKIFTITDAGVSATSQLLAQTAYEAPTGKDLDEIEMDNLQIRCKPAAGSFDMYIEAADSSYLADTFKINYLIG